MRKYLLPIIIFFIITTSLCGAQTPTLWGMTQLGGNDGVSDYGAIYYYNISSATAGVPWQFGGDTDGENPFEGNYLLQANDGLLYGYASGYLSGNSYGIMFHYNIPLRTQTVLCAFGIGNNGAGAPIQASNGVLYGVTSTLMFSYDISNNTATDLYNFQGDSDGEGPSGALVQASNGLLYGMTNAGDSVYDDGTIFSYDITDNKENVVYEFGKGTDGTDPQGALIQATNGLLYGMTYSGGDGTNPDLRGTIFSFNDTTNVETDIHDFGNDSDGYEPVGSLIQASNGLLYGMTSAGGVYGGGIIFSYSIANDMEIVLHNFGNGTDGSGPQGALMQGSDGLLYGTTEYGGTNNTANGGDGTVFSYDIAKDTEIDIHDFGGSYDGMYPVGTLVEVDTPATGVKQLSVNNYQLSIYPNPTSGEFTMTVSGNQNGYEVGVYNVMGEEVYESVLSGLQNTIDVSSQPAGLYFVYLKSGEGVKVGKVMVTR